MYYFKQVIISFKLNNYLEKSICREIVLLFKIIEPKDNYKRLRSEVIFIL